MSLSVNFIQLQMMSRGLMVSRRPQTYHRIENIISNEFSDR